MGGGYSSFKARSSTVPSSGEAEKIKKASWGNPCDYLIYVFLLHAGDEYAEEEQAGRRKRNGRAGNSLIDRTQGTIINREAGGGGRGQESLTLKHSGVLTEKTTI